MGTFGAIVGTVLTGFVLVSRLPVSTILIGLGTLLVLGAAVVGRRARRWRRTTAVALATVVAGSLATAFAPGGCDAETRYHCARVVADPDRNSGRTLVLDGLNHSYVDVEDPAHLKFAYVRALASVVDTAFPEGEPLTAHHIGGGGLTFPRYLAAARPGTRSLVSEIDGGVVRIDHERFGLGPSATTGVDVRVEDGRLGLRRLAAGSRDLIVGDAFGGVSVPWHLTTAQALGDVRRALDEDGLYVANLIDHGALAFARAEVATLASVFPHVALMGKPHGHRAGPDGFDDRRQSGGGRLRPTGRRRRGPGGPGRQGRRLADHHRRRPRHLDRERPGAHGRLRARRPAPPAQPHPDGPVNPGPSGSLTRVGSLTGVGPLTRARTATGRRTRRPPRPVRHGCPAR